MTPSHRARASAFPTAPFTIDTDPERVEAFLSDAAHVPGGHAAGVVFPRSIAEVAAVVSRATRVLPIGAQSSLTGGATPRGDLVLSTRALTDIGAPQAGEVRIGAGVPLNVLQTTLAQSGLYYPPVPTFDGAFVGGTVSTNAAGAATFKYGSTRQWVRGLVVVLADGSVLNIRRGQVIASPQRTFEIEHDDGTVVTVPVPTYLMPRVAKLSAGYYAAPNMDLVDLFVGSEGTLGIIVEATLGVVTRPQACVALVECTDDEHAVAVTAALRGWPDVAAVEYMDSNSLRILPDDTFTRCGVARPPAGAILLLVQFEAAGDEGAAVNQLADVLGECAVESDPVVAMPADAASAARLFALREAVPMQVNATIGIRKQHVPGLQKTAGDMIVPFERLLDSIAVYRREFERRGLEYAIWGHMSDGNLHPNVVPSSLADVERGIDALHAIAGKIMSMGGAPLAEHGVGRSVLKQQLLRDLYGNKGIEEMRAVKRALDPSSKLAAGVLFPASGSE